jgi:hypothetical protein
MPMTSAAKLLPWRTVKEIRLVGKDWREYSLDTVKKFYNDTQQAKYCL